MQSIELCYFTMSHYMCYCNAVTQVRLSIVDLLTKRLLTYLLVCFRKRNPFTYFCLHHIVYTCIMTSRACRFWRHLCNHYFSLYGWLKLNGIFSVYFRKFLF